MPLLSVWHALCIALSLNPSCTTFLIISLQLSGHKVLLYFQCGLKFVPRADSGVYRVNKSKKKETNSLLSITTLMDAEEQAESTQRTVPITPRLAVSPAE